MRYRAVARPHPGARPLPLNAGSVRPSTPESFDFTAPSLQGEFHAPVAELRRRRGPVLWSERHRAWLVLSHRAVTAGFREPGLSSDRTGSFRALSSRSAGALDQVADLLAGWMVFRDPPVHEQLRGPVAAAFTPRRVSALEGAIASATDRLLDQLRPDRPCDLRRDLAAPLPATVIADLLGIPPGRRRHLREWSDGLAGVVFAVGNGARQTDLVSRPARAAADLSAHLAELLDHYRHQPADNLLSALSSMSGPASGLSDQEVIGAAMLLLFAGHETTTTLICNSVWSLLAWPDQLARVRRRPELWGSAVDELVRYEGPSKAMVRKVATTGGAGPVRLEGQEMAPGENVLLMLAAANRDEAVFRDPDRLDLGRQPNPHLGFGWGRHHCLGASLARLETRICLSRLFERYPGLSTVAAAPDWGGGVIGRAARTLVVRLTP